MKAKDLTGQRFGRLVVLGEEEEPYRSPTTGRPTRRWRCRCDCGKEIVVLQNALTRKNGTKSCGCARAEKTRANAIDMTGQRFGRLVVLGPEELDVPMANGQKLAWRCRCDCGNEIVITRKGLVSNKTQSCGCLLAESSAKRLPSAVGQTDGTTLSAIVPTRKANRNSKSGVKGVYWNTQAQRWIASITFRRQKITLGRFRTIEEAAKARKAAEEKYFKPVLEKHKKEEIE